MLGTHPCPWLSPGPGAVLTCPGGEGGGDGGDGGRLRVAGSERHHVLGVRAQVGERGRLCAGPQALLLLLGCSWRGAGGIRGAQHTPSPAGKGCRGRAPCPGDIRQCQGWGVLGEAGMAARAGAPMGAPRAREGLPGAWLQPSARLGRGVCHPPPRAATAGARTRLRSQRQVGAHVGLPGHCAHFKPCTPKPPGTRTHTPALRLCMHSRAPQTAHERQSLW